MSTQVLDEICFDLIFKALKSLNLYSFESTPTDGKDFRIKLSKMIKIPTNKTNETICFLQWMGVRTIQARNFTTFEQESLQTLDKLS